MFNTEDKTNAYWNALSFVIISILAFANFSIIVKTYDSTILGLFILFNSILGIGNNLDLGFGISTIKNIAEAKFKKDFILINQIYVTFLFAYITVGLVIVSIIVLYYEFFLKNSQLVLESNLQNVDSVFYILVGSFIIRYIGNYFRIVIDGFKRFVLSAKVNIFIAILNLILIAVLFLMKPPIIYLALIYFSVALISILAFYIAANLKLENLKFSLKNFRISIIKKYASYGFNVQASLLIGNSVDAIIKYLLGLYLNLSYITFFEVAKKIIDNINGVIISSQRGLFNTLSEYNVNNSLKEFINSKLNVYSSMALKYSILVYGILNPLICFLIFKWFGFYESILIFLIFSIPYSLICIFASLYNVFMVQGKAKFLLLFQIINILTVSIILYTSLSLTGSFIGLFAIAISNFLNILLMVIFLKKIYQFNYSSYFNEIGIKNIYILLLLILVQFLVLYYYPEYMNEILISFGLVYSLIFYKFFRTYFNHFKILFGKLRS